VTAPLCAAVFIATSWATIPSPAAAPQQFHDLRGYTHMSFQNFSTSTTSAKSRHRVGVSKPSAGEATFAYQPLPQRGEVIFSGQTCGVDESMTAYALAGHGFVLAPDGSRGF
jgi:hypothetical protein